MSAVLGKETWTSRELMAEDTADLDLGFVVEVKAVAVVR